MGAARTRGAPRVRVRSVADGRRSRLGGVPVARRRDEGLVDEVGQTLDLEGEHCARITPMTTAQMPATVMIAASVGAGTGQAMMAIPVAIESRPEITLV